MAKDKTPKTNAVRILERMGIHHEIIPYEVDENDLGATHIAAQLGQDINQIFKTLVLRGNKTGVFVCVIPGGEEVDLKKAARASGNKNCDMVHMKELLPLTGYIRGGCTAIGMKKDYPVWIHLSALEQPVIHVSAGQRGLQVKLAPADFIQAAKATVADLVVERNQEKI